MFITGAIPDNLINMPLTKKGKEIMSFPLTIGVVGAIVAPMLAAVGTVAALITECTLTVERVK